MDHDVIEACSRLSFEGVPFPEIVRRLGRAGVRSYYADLVQRKKTYYDGRQETYNVSLDLTEAPPIAESFDESGVVAPLRTIQRGEIDYAAFLRKIMQAGCTSYSVFIAGRKAIYFGRDGQFHVEHFPQPSP